MKIMTIANPINSFSIQSNRAAKLVCLYFGKKNPKLLLIYSTPTTVTVLLYNNGKSKYVSTSIGAK